jgi:hypothetical protein
LQEAKHLEPRLVGEPGEAWSLWPILLNFHTEATSGLLVKGLMALGLESLLLPYMCTKAVLVVL